MAKPQYTKPTSQVDLEARQKSDYQNPAVLLQGSDDEPSDNGYVGVDPIYQTFANETEKPGLAESGPEKKVEAGAYSDDVDVNRAATPEGEAQAEAEATTPAAPATPPKS